MNKSAIFTGAAAVVLAALLAACGGSSGSSHSLSPSASAALQTAKANAQSDVQAAQGLLADCVKAHPGSVSGIKTCVLAQVPKDRQAALKSCLVAAAANDLKADHHVKAAASDFETSSVPGRGAQPCIATALKSPAPGSSAAIPGVTATPTPSATVTVTPRASKS